MKSHSLVLLHLNNYEIGKNQDVTNDADWEASKLASLNPTPRILKATRWVHRASYNDKTILHSSALR